MFLSPKFFLLQILFYHIVLLFHAFYKIYNQSVKREEALMEEIRVNRETNAKAIETIAQYSSTLEVMKQDINDIKTDVAILTAK